MWLKEQEHAGTSSRASVGIEDVMWEREGKEGGQARSVALEDVLWRREGKEGSPARSVAFEEVSWRRGEGREGGEEHGIGRRLVEEREGKESCEVFKCFAAAPQPCHGRLP